MVCVCVFVCVERPQKLRLDLKKVNASWSTDHVRLVIVKLTDNMARYMWTNTSVERPSVESSNDST
jgi:hypothetical protein